MPNRTARRRAAAVSDSSCSQPWAAANALTQKCLSLSIYLGVQKLPNFSRALQTHTHPPPPMPLKPGAGEST